MIINEPKDRAVSLMSNHYIQSVSKINGFHAETGMTDLADGAIGEGQEWKGRSAYRSNEYLQHGGVPAISGASGPDLPRAPAE